MIPGGGGWRLVRRLKYGEWALRQVGEGEEALLHTAMYMKWAISAIESVDGFVEASVSYCH